MDNRSRIATSLKVKVEQVTDELKLSTIALKAAINVGDRKGAEKAFRAFFARVTRLILFMSEN